ncbi:MAG: hypothetical protein LBH47_03420 [Christensenellaceae bacterium]|jgi:hypothetical protein|nr:hypothetical protein [Christensenellaceae bacterium]
MLIKVPYENNLFEIAKACKAAPCSIIFANNKRNEQELFNLNEILVPIDMDNFCEITDIDANPSS